MTIKHENIAAALAAFQGEMPTIPKSKTAKVPTKAGGSYQYSYADLADMTALVMPALARHGLAFITAPRVGEHGRELVGTLLHESGGTLEGALPIGGNAPQEIGSALTYMRRYLLGCLTGVVTDDDDDGSLAQASASPQTRQQSHTGARTRREAAPSSRPDGSPVEPLRTEAQSRALFAALTEAGVTEREYVLAWLSELTGREIESTKSLTEAEASRAVDAARALIQPAEEVQA